MPGFDAGSARRIARAVRMGELRPDPAGLRRASPPRVVEPVTVFLTTLAITSAIVSGTTVSTAMQTLGSGKARRCILDASGNDIPDTTRIDETIYNPVEMTSPSSINTGLFVECVQRGGKRRIVDVQNARREASLGYPFGYAGPCGCGCGTCGAVCGCILPVSDLIVTLTNGLSGSATTVYTPSSAISGANFDLGVPHWDTGCFAVVGTGPTRVGLTVARVIVQCRNDVGLSAIVQGVAALSSSPAFCGTNPTGSIAQNACIAATYSPPEYPHAKHIPGRGLHDHPMMQECLP